MKFTRHAWGVFKRQFNHRTGEWSDRFISSHKTSVVAAACCHRGEVWRRLTKAERHPQ